MCSVSDEGNTGKEGNKNTDKPDTTTTTTSTDCCHILNNCHVPGTVLGALVQHRISCPHNSLCQIGVLLPLCEWRNGDREINSLSAQLMMMMVY